MPATHRLIEERLFHDRQADDRATCLARDDALVFATESYLDHESWIKPAFVELGDMAGLRVLDFGCGHGMASVVFARQGARVVGFDLSVGYLQEARRRARANGVPIEFVCADGERLPFADGSFERIWGNAVLHHLDIPRAARELHRLLAPGGKAVFCEPWGDNLLLAGARRWLPYPGKQRTSDERPLRSDCLSALRNSFPDLRIQGFQLFSMVRRATGGGRLSNALAHLDERILRAVPGLWRYCRYAVLTLPRGEEGDREI